MSVRNTMLSSLALVVAFAGGAVVTRVTGSDAPRPAFVADPAAPVVDQAKPAPAGLPAFSPLPALSNVAERAIQASVNISSTTQMRVDPFFQMFYGADAVVPQTSLGS